MNQSKKILALALIFFFSGLSFFYFRMTQHEPVPNILSLKGEGLKPNRAPREIILKNMPDPKNFKTFTYKGEASMKVDLDCRDQYGAVLIYSEEVDYRYDPLGARFNTAYPCDNRKKFDQEIILKSVNLENGLKYYIVKAQQGNTGGWYDPY